MSKVADPAELPLLLSLRRLVTEPDLTVKEPGGARERERERRHTTKHTFRHFLCGMRGRRE
jgi:hypothetical protein